MSKHTILILLVALFASFCYATDDNQEYRANVSFSFKVNDQWKMKITNEFHFRDGEHFEQEDEVLFTYKGFADWLDVGVGFKQVYQEDSSSDWQRENRPFAEFTVKKKRFGLKWSDRNRLEFRDYEDGTDKFRYRNRLKASVPVNIFDLPLQPYVADEINIMEEDGYYRNRIYAGLVWDVNEKMDVDFFFFHQKDKKTGGWDDRFFTGFELKFSF